MSINNRYPYMVEFFQHLHKRLHSPKNTIDAYEDDLKNFFDWLLTSYGYNDVLKLTKDHLYKYRDYLEERCYAQATVRRRLATVRQFVGYLLQTEVIPEENDPWPPRMKFRGTGQPPSLVPTPAEIFRMRMRANVRLEHAWFLELALSTGMRVDEITQLRSNDFNFTDRPFDVELGRPSPYFVGSIQLTPARHKLKNNTPRKVFFSYLAGELTKQYLCKNGLSNSQPLPAFPWSRQNAGEWMSALGKGIINVYNQNAVGTGLMENEASRDRYFSDVDLKQAKLDPQFELLVRRRQKAGEGLETYKRQIKPVRVKKRNLHPHSLRHAFTSFIYYRNPMGERSAQATLRLLMGHADYNSTFFYLRDLCLIKTDATWKQLWLGKPHDWNGINR